MENTEQNKEFKILGYSIWRIFAFFILYSILGYVIETVFGVFTKGVLESRKGFLYGPFCPIYGVGGVTMVLSLKRFTKNNYTLFFAGTVVGAVIEYLISLFGEMIFNVKWWDYSNEILNINGRICLSYSFIWGFLAIYLMKHIHPKIVEIIDWSKGKLSRNGLKTAISIIMIILLIDGLMTAFALKVYYSRLVHDYNLKVENYESYIIDYERIHESATLARITDKLFNNRFMLKTFPNLTMQAKDGSTIYINDILKPLTPYYFKLFTPKEIKLYHLDLNGEN